MNHIDINAIHEHVNLIRDFQDDEKYYAFLASNNIIILNYDDAYYYRSSGVFIEALYFRKIVITIQNTWMGKILKLLDCGAVYSRGNTTQLINVTKEVLNNLQKYQKKVDDCYNTFLRLFDSSKLFTLSLENSKIILIVIPIFEKDSNTHDYINFDLLNKIRLYDKTAKIYVLTDKPKKIKNHKLATRYKFINGWNAFLDIIKLSPILILTMRSDITKKSNYLKEGINNKCPIIAPHDSLIKPYKNWDIGMTYRYGLPASLIDIYKKVVIRENLIRSSYGTYRHLL